MTYTGAESLDICVDAVTSSSAELTNWPRRQTRTAATATQHTVGNDLSRGDSRGLVTLMFELLLHPALLLELH